MILTGKKLNNLNKTCPNTTVSTTNITCTGLESNPCLLGVRPATSRLGKAAGLRRRRRRRKCGDTTCVQEGKQKIFCSEISWVMTARPSDKCVLEEVEVDDYAVKLS